MNGPVLIVEDDGLIALALEAELVAAGFDVCGVAATAHDALSLADRHTPRMAVVDVNLSNRGDGITVARHLETACGTAVLFFTANADIVMRQADIGWACLSKPCAPDAVARSMRAVERLADGLPTETRLPHNLVLLRRPRDPRTTPAN